MNYLAASYGVSVTKKAKTPNHLSPQSHRGHRANKSSQCFLCALCDSSERIERVVMVLALLTKQASGNATQGFDSRNEFDLLHKGNTTSLIFASWR
jgi:hypothetical protein